MRTCWLLVVAFGWALWWTGACAAPEGPGGNLARERMLTLLLPRSVEIVSPFTRVQSVPPDHTEVRLELRLRASNALDNPGLMVVGDVRVEFSA